ncbi:cyclic-phosphate processing receiver domain-containing protein [Nocardia xishanensis]|uniref:cyclic-phosphate processing receiver domain-containing protein n=1 Tax=Nocardia xishanensis TaxID=238964 RepID=UPI00083738EC|nr:cyclic-phosphate processing receiver domain-containing protein [Nocardia xishanensis]
MKLFVDDERPAPDGWVRVETSAEALSILSAYRLDGHTVEAISLDHDLGGDDTTRPVMLWMCEHDWWPLRLTIHSANPVGRDHLAGMARRYAPDWVKVDSR